MEGVLPRTLPLGPLLIDPLGRPSPQFLYTDVAAAHFPLPPLPTWRFVSQRIPETHLTSSSGPDQSGPEVNVAPLCQGRPENVGGRVTRLLLASGDPGHGRRYCHMGRVNALRSRARDSEHGLR